MALSSAPHPPPLVFVVDSAPEFLALMRDVFQEEGYAVATTNQTPTTFAEIAAAPALLVIDLAITHPQIWSLVARLEGDDATRGIPQLFLSTLASMLAEAKGRCTAPDRQRFLEKPLDLDTLLATSRELIGTA